MMKRKKGNGLKFSIGNSKLNKDTAIFDLPAGHSCLFAEKCLAFANRETGKVTDGKDTEFRCYAASQEAIYSNLRRARWNNFDLLKGKSIQEMIEMISNDLPDKPIIRIHSSGDFFSLNYFKAWLQVARDNSDKIFYTYTKSIPYWMKLIGEIPANFKLNASMGGKCDDMALKNSLKTVRVVFSKYRARKLGLKLDHDDRLAYTQSKSFALLIHGTQKAETEASRAWQRVKNAGGGYSKK